MRPGLLARLTCVLLTLPICGTAVARAIISPTAEPRETLTRRAEIAAQQNAVPATRKYLAESLAMLDSVSNRDSDYGARLLDSGRAELAIDERGAAERHLTDALKYLERGNTQRLGVAVALTSLG